MEANSPKEEYRRKPTPAEAAQRREKLEDERYYDSHTIYIENNNNSEEQIRRIIDQIISSHSDYKNLDINPASKYILNYRDDNSVCMVYDSAIYDFIFALDEKGNEIDLLKGENMSFSKFRTISELRDTKPEKELLALAHPCKVRGQTPISKDNVDSWKDYLRDKNDIALMQMYTVPVRDFYIKDTLTVRNVPDWSPEYLKEFFYTICPNATSINVLYREVELNFESSFMEGSFKLLLLNNLRLLVRLDGSIPVYKTLNVTYKIGNKQATNVGSMIDTGGSPFKPKQEYSTSKSIYSRR